MHDAPYSRLPLRNRRREIVAYALVDDADLPRVGGCRWHLNPYGYVVRRLPRRFGSGTIWLHREIMGLTSAVREPASWFWSVYGEDRAQPVAEVDHINGDPLDNRRANLRIVNRAENAQNLPGHGATSRHRGVSLYRRTGKWIAFGRVNGKVHYLGYFDDEDEAGEVAAAWRREHMPFSTR